MGCPHTPDKESMGIWRHVVKPMCEKRRATRERNPTDAIEESVMALGAFVPVTAGCEQNFAAIEALITDQKSGMPLPVITSPASSLRDSVRGRTAHRHCNRVVNLI